MSQEVPVAPPCKIIPSSRSGIARAGKNARNFGMQLEENVSHYDACLRRIGATATVGDGFPLPKSGLRSRT